MLANGAYDAGEIIFTHRSGVDETLGNIHAVVNEQLDYEGAVAAQRGDDLRLAGLAAQSVFFNTFFPRSFDEAVIGGVGGAVGGAVVGRGIGLLATNAPKLFPVLGRNVSQDARWALNKLGEAFPRGSADGPRLPMPGAQVGMIDLEVFFGIARQGPVNSPFVTPYDPRFPGRPDPAFSVDTTTFTNPIDYNAAKFPRDAGQFWQQWLDLQPESMSASNRYLIDNYGRLRTSPRIDDTWLQAFPEQAAYRGDVLVHHHVNHGQYAIPVPSRTHPGNSGPWHFGP